MKKNLFFAFFACVALAFVSCEEPVQPVDYSLTLNQTTVELEVGGSVKLNAIVSPAGEQVPVITWTSSDSEVAVVNASGIVEAVATGTATITATLNVEGVAPATCTVNVTNDAILNNFTVGGFELFDLGAPIAGTDTVLEISVGAVNCQLAMGLYYIWDDGIVMAGNSLTGAGFLAPVEAPTYVIMEGDYAGYYISVGELVVDTVPEDVYAPYTGQAGQLLDVQMYGDAWKAILNFPAEPSDEEINTAYELYYGSQTGAQFFHVDFNTGAQSYNYGNVSYVAILEDDSLGLLFDLKLEWYDNVNDGRLYGLAAEEVVTEAGDTTIALVEPYDMRLIHKAYSNMPIVEEEEEETTETAALKPMKMRHFNQKTVAILNETKKMYKK